MALGGTVWHKVAQSNTGASLLGSMSESEIRLSFSVSCGIGFD